MKSITLTLAALLCSTSPILASDLSSQIVSEVQQSNLYLGKDYVESVRGQYASGAYNEFLKEMDETYNKAKEENQLEGLIAMRQEDAAIAKEHSKEIERWNKMATTWTHERNRDLLKAVDDQSDSILGKKVKSISEENSSDVEKAVAAYLNLRNFAPGEGKNADENLLIDLDLESEYKQIHLDSLALDGSISDTRQKHLVLVMEKMDRMLEASKKFEDQELKRTVELLAKTADVRYAKGIDLKDLNHLVRDKDLVLSESEKKVASILSSYQGKFTDLTKEMFDSSTEANN